MHDFMRPSKSHWMTCRIARGEQGVLTYEPYKSYLLPHWRFCTVPIARASSERLWETFLDFYEEHDFVGMDMTRKFIQMGMTRAMMYANHKGGRKYVDGKEQGNLVGKSKGHKGKEEKEEASRIFKEVLERCKAHDGYGGLKKEFLMEQRAWEAIKKEDQACQGKGYSVREKDEAEKCSTLSRSRSRKVVEQRSD